MEIQFYKYIEEFDVEDVNIKVKIDHSLRVRDLCVEIGKSLNLNKELLYLCELIGLLHDIGRFEQWKVYHTFIDKKSIDHALLSTKILFDEGLIRNFIKDDKYDEIIKTAIFHHNKYKLPKDLDEVTSILSKIIRDADKIDILKIRVEDPNFSLKSKGKIDDLVLKKYMSHKSIRFKYIKSANDSIVLTLSMIYDINYYYSFKLLKEKGYMNKIVNSLKVKNQDKIKFELDNYIDKKLMEGDINVRKTIQFENS